MATCPTCRNQNAEEYKSSHGTRIVCRMCNPVVDVVVISLSIEFANAALVFAKELRQRGIKTQTDTRIAKPKKKFEFASRLGAYYVVTFGADEISRGVCQVKDLDAKAADPNKQVELSVGAALCLLEYMLVPGAKVSGRITPQKIIQIGNG